VINNLLPIMTEEPLIPTDTPNPLAPEQSLKRPAEAQPEKEAHPPQPIFEEDSAVTKAEKVERHGPEVAFGNAVAEDEFEESPAKRLKLEPDPTTNTELPKADAREKVKGIALVKPE
jgi:tRNA-dihydrouridine synthase 3